ncbi:CRISPR-associated Cas1 family protein [Oscillochloris trichoides DG-6]|uniref:CRISPR-associated endonuclease Cas1 n=1 Tax=Oscillochloris trichoides DG-6 TaxID=765420 RepID=E1IGC9_9CHLR|nr:CRISPR-associated endonuclease Cas1 [Oscillochloris trichoides]EFO79695.1 CRISPR-associated Cas1 family protein [Oscillochloris trichoides DG-6]
MATLYVIEQGAEIGCDGERIVVRRQGQEIGSVPISRLDDILIIGNIGISTPALKRLFERGIEVTFLTVHGRYQGRLVGATTPHAALRRAQYRRADDPAWSLSQAQACVTGKLRNARVLLQRFARNRSNVSPDVSIAADDLSTYIARIERTTQLSSLLGVEGSATARYFGGLRALFEPDWQFHARSRRPPGDPVNVLLSLGYTLLLHKVTAAIAASGLDPYMGYLHQIEYGRASLALDMMEEFRPLLVDSLVLRCCGDGRVQAEDFRSGGEGERAIVFSPEGQRRFISAFEERMRTEATHPEGADSGPGKVSYMRCLELQARRLVRAIQGSTPYEPFIAR